MNVVIQLEFEPTYYDFTIQHVSNYATGLALNIMNSKQTYVKSSFNKSLSLGLDCVLCLFTVLHWFWLCVCGFESINNCLNVLSLWLDVEELFLLVSIAQSLGLFISCNIWQKHLLGGWRLGIVDYVNVYGINLFVLSFADRCNVLVNS